MNKIVIGVEGMACEGCENKVRNAIADRYAPEKIEVSHKKAVAKFNCEAEVTEDEIRALIAEAGFTMTSYECSKKHGLF